MSGVVPLSGVDVLLVEDDPDSREASKLILEGAGATVHTATSGREMLRQLETTVQLPDVILTDLRMPSMDGFALAAALQSSPVWQLIPLVAVSGATTAPDVRATLAAGYSAHLDKPVDVDMLIAVLQGVARTARPAGNRGLKLICARCGGSITAGPANSRGALFIENQVLHVRCATGSHGTRT
jgi:CheY-like chemotaxis protein